MKSHVRVLIIGGGSLGVNLLYHLTQAGWTDIALVEKGALTSGSTWHAAGLCPHFNGNPTLSHIHAYTTRLYDDILPAATGEPSVFHKTGSLRLGFSQTEAAWFTQLQSHARYVGAEFHLIGRDDARRLNPFMDFSKAHVIAYTPADGHVDPTAVVMPLARLARRHGAEIYQHNRVLAINALASGDWQVITEQGALVAEHVVNAAGCFAPQIGAMVGATVPLVNLEHQYLVTESHPDFADLDHELPVCRDAYSCAYIRQEGQGFLVGPYETRGAKLRFADGLDWAFDRQLLDADLERILPWLERCYELTPRLADCGVKTVINGLITHTPDDNLLVGPQAGLRNFWNLNGASIGIAQGGVGRYLAQWMVHGQTEIDMAPLDSRRFGPWADKPYQRIKAVESYHTMYEVATPNTQRPQGRPQRSGPLYARLLDKGAVYGVVSGYEKPLYFMTTEVGRETPAWGHSEAFPAVRAECLAVRDAAGITDLSGAGRYHVTGPDAAALLNRLSSNTLPRITGRMVLTLFHTPNGGIVTEMTVTRLSEQRFYLNGPLVNEQRDLDWMQRHSDGFDVDIRNVTATTGALLLTGPKAREILQPLTDTPLSTSAFRWLSAQPIRINDSDVLALRVSYAGELGWELHAPAHQLPAIYDALWRQGADLGLKDFGGYALNALRYEKAYRAYGHEFNETVSGVETGMQRFIDTRRDFLGRDELQRRLANGVTRQLGYLVFDDDLPCECHGNESVLRDGAVIGVTTGGAYGHRVNRSLALALLNTGTADIGDPVTVLTALGERRARLATMPIYDPDNRRLRA